MKKSSFAYLLLALPFAAGAVNMATPITVSGTRFSQDRQTQKVTVKYALANQGEPAWVTMDVLTNGVSIGMQYVKTVRGDISQRGADFMASDPVADDGQEKTIVWDARKDWYGNIGSNASIVVSAWYTNFVPEVYMVVDLSEGTGCGSGTSRPARSRWGRFRTTRGTTTTTTRETASISIR